MKSVKEMVTGNITCCHRLTEVKDCLSEEVLVCVAEDMENSVYTSIVDNIWGELKDDINSRIWGMPSVA